MKRGVFENFDVEQNKPTVVINGHWWLMWDFFKTPTASWTHSCRAEATWTRSEVRRDETWLLLNHPCRAEATWTRDEAEGVKREKRKLPQTPLSISWLGEAKRAGKALVECQSEIQPGDGKARKLEVKTSAAARVSGAGAKQQRRRQPGARAKERKFIPKEIM